MKLPTYSIIIPTLNEDTQIAQLLDAISAQTYQPEQIIVVDAHSSDQTVQISKRYPKVSVLNSTPNIGHQRSLGGHKATSDYLFFLDADTQPERDFAQKVLHLCAKKNLDIACPWYWPLHSTLLIKSCYAFFNGLFYLFQYLQPSGAGSCIVVKRQVFVKHKGFRNDLKFDDIEFIRRVGRRHRFRTLPIVLHVSDRRFRKHGVLPTMLTYLVLSLLFFFHLFTLANSIPYLFGQYAKQTKHTHT